MTAEYIPAERVRYACARGDNRRRRDGGGPDVITVDEPERISVFYNGANFRVPLERAPILIAFFKERTGIHITLPTR